MTKAKGSTEESPPDRSGGAILQLGRAGGAGSSIDDKTTAGSQGLTGRPDIRGIQVGLVFVPI